MLFTGGMCPLWPLHIVIMYLMAMVPLWMACFGAVSAAASRITFDPAKVERLMEGQSSAVDVEFSDLPPGDYVYRVIVAEDTALLDVQPTEIVFRLDEGQTSWKEALNLTGVGLGYTSVRVQPIHRDAGGSSSKPHPPAADDDASTATSASPSAKLPVSVVRSDRKWEIVFVHMVIILVALTYVNMGCTLDLKVICAVFRRPVGPVIGVITQYLVMPLSACGLALAFFTDPGFQLGLLLTGCSPGGGASNIWTYLLNGNVNLSVTMTFVSAIVAFGMVPLWIYALARFFVEETTVVIPYRDILSVLFLLVVPCGVGLLINRYLPRVSAFLKKMLKPWSVVLFIVLVVFGILTHLHIWRLLTWKLVGVSALLPIAGFIGGAIASYATRRSWEDIIAISIETGVQNTGAAIFMIKFFLPEPASDLSIVVPVIVASATPGPLFAALIYDRVRRYLYPAPEKQPMAELANGHGSSSLHPSESGRALIRGDTPARDDARDAEMAA